MEFADIKAAGIRSVGDLIAAALRVAQCASRLDYEAIREDVFRGMPDAFLQWDRSRGRLFELLARMPHGWVQAAQRRDWPAGTPTPSFYEVAAPRLGFRQPGGGSIPLAGLTVKAATTMQLEEVQWQRDGRLAEFAKLAHNLDELSTPGKHSGVCGHRQGSATQALEAQVGQPLQGGLLAPGAQWPTHRSPHA